jgi:hypothetical protein
MFFYKLNGKSSKNQENIFGLYQLPKEYSLDLCMIMSIIICSTSFIAYLFLLFN